MTATRLALAPGIARWAEPLAALDAELAVAIGPMLHVIDDLVSRLDEGPGELGEPEGYDGITNRGTPERLVLGEWALADAVPEEFLRRAAENELTYLRRAHRAPAPRGRVVAFVDSGPEQLGPGRLVQLAALVVLAGKAQAMGSEFALQTFPGGALHTGTVPELFTRWLRSRSASSPTREQFEGALAATDDDDRVWLLTGPEGARLAVGHPRQLISEVSSWDASGAREVTVRIGNASSRLTLPDTRVSVAALRGEGLFSRNADPTVAKVPSTGRGATFGSADTRVLWRGDDDNEIYALALGSGEQARPRRYRTSGPVLAAASLGRRVVALVAVGDRLRVRVFGKKLARVDAFDAHLGEVGLDQAQVAAMMGAPLGPLYLNGGAVLVELAGRWWNLDPVHGAEILDLVAVAPGRALDVPRMTHSFGHLVEVLPGVALAADLLAGFVHGPVDARAWRAWSVDSRTWRVARDQTEVEEITVAEGERVLGLALIGRAPALVVTSGGNILLRHVTALTTHTWTRWSGPGEYALHPTRPWVARSAEGRIVVGDLSTGATLADIRSTP